MVCRLKPDTETQCGRVIWLQSWRTFADAVVIVVSLTACLTVLWTSPSTAITGRITICIISHWSVLQHVTRKQFNELIMKMSRQEDQSNSARSVHCNHICQMVVQLHASSKAHKQLLQEQLCRHVVPSFVGFLIVIQHNLQLAKTDHCTKS